MSALFLTESDVEQLIDMPRTIEIVESALVALHQGEAVNVPRSRAGMKGVLLHSMSASAEYLRCLGWKNYTTTRDQNRFHVALYNADSGAMECLIEADRLGQLRTGAATGVAVRHMTLEANPRVTMIGSGLQARTQLEAIHAVRPIASARVFSRDEERRTGFASEMSERLGIEVQPSDDVATAVHESDIVVCATTSPTPVFAGESLTDGAFVAAIGGNQASRSELDGVTLEAARSIVVDQIEQCQIEAGELIGGVKAGICRWEDMLTLGAVIAGDQECPQPETGINLFKSVGLAIQDVAMAHEILQRARVAEVGVPLPF